ncbi:MAG: hypothetical protein SO057_07205 [Atopobiaceae bacterium]|nr:hypothetical protein [Atopobiaceae bacterium]
MTAFWIVLACTAFLIVVHFALLVYIANLLSRIASSADWIAEEATRWTGSRHAR